MTANASVEQAGALASLVGKVAIVTGATKGIGFGCSLSLSRAGAFFWVRGGRLPGAADVVKQIEAAGGHAAAATLDVIVESEWVQLIDQIQTQSRRLDIVVNNAGDLFNSAIEQLPLEQVWRLAHLNIEGAFLGMTHAWPL